MAVRNRTAASHSAVLAAAQQLAPGKDGLSAKLSHAAVQILLQAGDGPIGPHSMVSTAYGAQLCASVQLNEWHTIPPPRLHNVLQDIPFIRTTRVPGLQHAVMVLDVDALLAQAGAHGKGPGSSKHTQSPGQHQVVEGSASTPLANGPTSAPRSASPIMHTQYPVTPKHLAQVLPVVKAGAAPTSAAAAAGASSSPQSLPGTHTDAASFVLQLMAMAVFRPKSAEDHATHLRCFAACFLARHKDRYCPLPNSCDIKLLGALLNRAGSPEQQALMNYKPHIVHRGQKVQALATLDSLHVLQLDPPEPAHPPHFAPAGAGNRQQRIVLCVDALQAAAQVAVGNVLGIGPLSILPLPYPTPTEPNPATASPTAPGKHRVRASLQCQLRVFDERAAGRVLAQNQALPMGTAPGSPEEGRTQTSSNNMGTTVTEASFPASTAAVEAKADSATGVPAPAAPAAPATTDQACPSEARPVVLQIMFLEDDSADEPGGVAVSGQLNSASAAAAAAPSTTTSLLPLEQEQAQAQAAQLARERGGGGVAAGDEADDGDLVQCPDLATCVREVYQAAAERATVQASRNSDSGSGSVPTARLADGVTVALLKQYVATHLLSVVAGPLGPHSITGPNLGMLLNKCPPQLLKLYESLPKPRMRSLLMRPMEDGPGGLTNYYDDGILRAVHHKDNLGVALDVAALQDAWRKDQAAAAIARNSARQYNHPSTHAVSHKAHAKAAALSAKAASQAAAAALKSAPSVGSVQSQLSPLFDPSGGPHCPDLATCVHAVYTGDTLRRVLALALCKRTQDHPSLGPYTCVGPEIGSLLQKNPEAAPHYNALGKPKLRKLLEVKVPAGEGSWGGPNRPALADDGILFGVPFQGNQGVRLNVAALQEAYLKLRTPGGKQHTPHAISSSGFGTTTTTTNMSIANAHACPAAAAAASLNTSDARGLAVCMACLSVWAKADSGGVYGFGSQAGVALASLAVTMLCQPPHHAASNGGSNRYQLRHASRVIERTLNMLSAEGWGGAGPAGGLPKSPSAGPQFVSQVLQQGAPWLQVLDQEGLPIDLDALAIANLFAESGLFVELQVEALAQRVVEALSSSSTLASPTKDSVHTLMREKATGKLVPKPKPLAPSASAAGWPPQLGLAPAQKVLKFLQQHAAKARTRLRIVLAHLLEEAGLLQRQQLQQQQQAKMSMQEKAGIGSGADGGAPSPHAHLLALCLEQLRAIATNGSHNDVPSPKMGVVSGSGSCSSTKVMSGKYDIDGGVTLLQHAPHASASIQERPNTQCSPTEQGLMNGRAAPYGAAPTSTAAAAAAAAAATDGDFVLSTADGNVASAPPHLHPFEGPQDADVVGLEAMAQQQQQQQQLWDSAFSPTPQRARAALEARLAAQAGGCLAGMPMPQPVHGVHDVPMPQPWHGGHGGHGMVAPSAAAHGEHARQAQQQQQQQQQQVQLGVLDWGALDDAVDSGASGVDHHGDVSVWTLDGKDAQGAAHSRAHDTPSSVPPQQSCFSGPPPHGSAAQPYHDFHQYNHLYSLQQQQHLEQQMLGVDPTSASTLLPSCWQQQEEQGPHDWGAGAGEVPDLIGSDAHRLFPTSPDLVSNEGLLLAGKPSARQQQQSWVAEGGTGGEEVEGMNDEDLLALLVGGGVE